MKTLYSTKAIAEGGREGKVKTDDNILNLDVRMPNSMGGQGGEYTNPEQLFAAGYAACFDGALNLVARQARHKIKSEVNMGVSLLMSEEAGLNLKVDIEVKVEGVEREVAQQLIEQAHEVCPYSKATRNNIEVSLKLV